MKVIIVTATISGTAIILLILLAAEFAVVEGVGSALFAMFVVGGCGGGVGCGAGGCGCGCGVTGVACALADD